MNLPISGRPLSGRRRPTVAKRRHSISAVTAFMSSNRKPVEDELDEIPTAEELEAQMKLFGRLHTDEALTEWLGLGQASTIAEDLALEAEENRRRELEFVQRYESLFGDDRERMALLPPDVVEELLELEMQQLKEAEEAANNNNDDDDDDEKKKRKDEVSSSFSSSVRHKRKKVVVPLKFMIRERGLGDGNALDSGDDMEMARNSAGEIIEEEADDDANVINSWEAELAVRRALVSSGIADIGSDDQFQYSDNVPTEFASSRNKQQQQQRQRHHRAPLSRQLLGIASRSSGAAADDTSTFQDDDGEELFDEDKIYGKVSGEPLFIPAEPHYVGECPEMEPEEQEDEDEDEEEEEEGDGHDDDDDDDDGDNTPDTRSLGVMAIDAADKQQNHASRPVTSQLPEMSSLVSLTPTRFEIEMQQLLDHARARVAEMTDFVFKVEQDFWEDVQQRSLTRKASQQQLGGKSLELSLNQKSQQEGGDNNNDDEDDDDDSLFFPGRGPKEESLERLRVFIEQAVFQVDGVLADPLPERSAAEQQEQLLPDENRNAARRKKATRNLQSHTAASFFVPASPKGSRSNGGGDQQASPSSSSAQHQQLSPSPSGSPTAAQTAAKILATDTTSTNTGASTASGALQWEDRRYAVVLNVVVTLLDELLHKDNGIVQQTAAELDHVMQRMRSLEATSLAHVLFRDEALGEVHAVVERIQAVVRAATRVASHAQDEAVFRGVAQIFVAAARRMQDFAREVARIGEIALLDADDLRKRLAAARGQHETMVVALLELADAMETQPILVPRHAQWTRRALDDLFTNLQVAMATLATLEIAGDERADKIVSTANVARHIREMVTKQKKSFVEVALLYFPEEEGSVLTGVALAIAARRRLRETGRGHDRDWAFSIF